VGMTPMGPAVVARNDCGTACAEATCAGAASCGGAGTGAMSYVGSGRGQYMQETTYKYVGFGGDFDVVRNRNFTCIITGCCLLSLLLLLPLLWWLLSQNGTTLPYDCDAGLARFETLWSRDQQQFCCAMFGKGCIRTTAPTAPTTPRPVIPTVPPPTLPPTTRPVTAPPTTRPSGPVDPYNCAVGAVDTWDSSKKQWCCNVHHVGCPTYFPTAPPVPADPYNCAEGYENWVAGWSVAKKAWCCKVHQKGCPAETPGCGTTGLPYDCNAGFANWQNGWSVAKKAWCCKNEGKGCPPASGGCA